MALRAAELAAVVGQHREGLVTADNVTPWQACIRLSLGLTFSNEPEVVQDVFRRC